MQCHLEDFRGGIEDLESLRNGTAVADGVIRLAWETGPQGGRSYRRGVGRNGEVVRYLFDKRSVPLVPGSGCHRGSYAEQLPPRSGRVSGARAG